MLFGFLSTEEPRRVFIGIRDEGGQGTNPGPKRGAPRAHVAAETRHMPRFRGSTLAARAAPPACPPQKLRAPRAHIAAETRHLPRFRGNAFAARAAPPAARRLLRAACLLDSRFLVWPRKRGILPRFRGFPWAARAAPPAACCALIPLSANAPGF